MSRLEAVRAAYAAVDAGEFTPFLDLLDERIKWHLPGHSPFAGTTTSRDGLVARMLRQAERSGGTASLSFVGATASDNLVVVSERLRASCGGSDLDLGAIVVLRFEGDHVVEAWDFFDDQAAYDEFWSQD